MSTFTMRDGTGIFYKDWGAGPTFNADLLEFIQSRAQRVSASEGAPLTH